MLHAALIALYPFFGGLPSVHPASPLAPSRVEPAGTRVISVVEISGPDASNPDAPVELEQIETPDADPDLPALDDRPDARFPDRYRSASERLRAGQGDPRLWRELDPSVGTPTPEEVARLRLLTQIEAMNDSALIEAERARAATDWDVHGR